MHDPERRPIAARERRLSRQAAHWLAERGASPNGISVAGMIAGVLAGVCLAATVRVEFQTAGFLLAAVFIQLRLLANMFDGMVAIELEQTSAVGELFNEIPDRVSDVATLIGAGYAFGGNSVLGFVAACLAIFIAYVRAQGRAAGAPQEFCGPMAKQHRMFFVTVAALYAGLAPVGFQPVLSTSIEGGTIAAVLLIVIAGEVVTVFRRLSRIARALRRSTE